MNLKGNTILITGGTSGIGLELAKELHKLGNVVIVTGRDADKLAKAEQAVPGLKTIRSDAGNPKEIDALYAKITAEFPELNVIVNNAGFMRYVNLHKEEPLEGLTREIEVNLMGPIWMVARFLPMLKKKAQAAIVNVSSGLAFVPLPTSPVYCATKAALHSYTQSLRVQMKKTPNVKIFELCPPATETPLLRGSSDAEDLKDATVMPVEEMVRQTIRGLEKDKLEIRPGQANSLRFMNRLAPGFILGVLSKPVDRMLGQP
jgi:uncharacterized oxidoreductase